MVFLKYTDTLGRVRLVHWRQGTCNETKHVLTGRQGSETVYTVGTCVN